MAKSGKRGASNAGSQPCPCGGPDYAQCCGRFIDGAEIAATAGELMRSRYTAYVLRNEDYLSRSWHPDTRPSGPVTESDVTWLGLEVRAEQAQGDQASVEFVARCRIGGRGQRMHEISRFRREHGHWTYVDGSFPDKAAEKNQDQAEKTSPGK